MRSIAKRARFTALIALVRPFCSGWLRVDVDAEYLEMKAFGYDADGLAMAV